MNEKQLVSFGASLARLREDLLAQLESEQSAAETVVLDQTKVGRLSRMDAMQQQNMAQSTMRTIRARLQLINSALEKIASGDFGYCELCGEDIAPARLEAQPEAAYCFACQSQQEYHPQS